MHPHIMQGRTVVESPTWRGVRHGIVPRCLSGLQWPLIQVRSRAMGLKELRMKRGLTQQQLAEKIGVTRQHVAAYESGTHEIGNMTLNKALALCDALRVRNPRKLLDGRRRAMRFRSVVFAGDGIRKGPRSDRRPWQLLRGRSEETHRRPNEFTSRHHQLLSMVFCMVVTPFGELALLLSPAL